MADGLLDSVELAQHLGCTSIHIYTLIKRGLPHKRLGPGAKAPYRFSLPEVQEWLDRFSGGPVHVEGQRRRSSVYQPTHIL